METGVTRWIGRSVVSTMEARRKNRPAGTPGGSRTNGTPCCFSPSLDLLWLQVNRFRFTPEQAATIKEEAKRLESTTAFVRELIDDHRTMFGLPGIQVELLKADMKNLKIQTPREYVRHLLALSYQTLLEERAVNRKSGKR